MAPELAWLGWKEGSDKQVAVCRIANRTDRDYDFFGLGPHRPLVVLWRQEADGWRPSIRSVGDDCTPLYTLMAGSELLVEVPVDRGPGQLKLSMCFVEFLGDRWVRSEVETRPFPRR